MKNLQPPNASGIPDCLRTEIRPDEKLLSISRADIAAVKRKQTTINLMMAAFIIAILAAGYLGSNLQTRATILAHPETFLGLIGIIFAQVYSRINVCKIELAKQDSTYYVLTDKAFYQTYCIKGLLIFREGKWITRKVELNSTTKAQAKNGSIILTESKRIKMITGQILEAARMENIINNTAVSKPKLIT